jgi:hypothetical protein
VALPAGFFYGGSGTKDPSKRGKKLKNPFSLWLPCLPCIGGEDWHPVVSAWAGGAIG